MAFVAFLVLIVLLLLVTLKVSYREVYKNVVAYFKIMFVSFETLDELVEQDVVKFHYPFFEVAIINDPQLINQVLVSELCTEKFFAFYKFFNMDYGMISATSKRFHKSTNKLKFLKCNLFIKLQFGDLNASITALRSMS